MKKSQSSQWEHFERVVAAIHKAEDSGAIVTWDEDIDGRQFDVTIRFKQGLYEYLTVVECKDYKISVPVSSVEAFVTKSRTARANKAIMVSASGFQSGARKVAKDNNIELYTLTAVKMLPDEWLTDDYIDTLVIHHVRLIKAGSRKSVYMSEEHNMLPYLMKHVKIHLPDKQTSPDHLVNQVYSTLEDTVTKKQKTCFIDFPPGTIARIPFALRDIKVSRMAFVYQLGKGRLLKAMGFMFDPAVAFPPSYQFSNELTNEIKVFDPKNVRLGIDTKFEAGKFYRNPKMHTAYYCESIVVRNENGHEKEIATIYLVESYQNGELVQARYPQETKYGCYCIEVTDKNDLARLKRMYRELRKNEPPFIRNK